MVYVIGFGIITALGDNVAGNWHALLQEKDGLFQPSILQTIHKELKVGEIKLTNDDLAGAIGVNLDGISRTTLLGMYAMNEALQNIPEAIYQSKATAFINATTVGGMSDVENMYSEMIADDTEQRVLNYIDSLDCADCTMRIAKHFGFKGFQATISTACSSSANAILLGARMIKQGEASIAICGGTDALTRFTLNGFNTLKNVDKNPSKPFDQNRNGLNLGEAAAYVVMVDEAILHQLKVKPVAVFSGYGNTNEAHHPTAPSPDGKGALLTMQEALKNAKLSPEKIGYINAHGTATQGNDISEGNAIKKLFGNDTPFSSTKSFTGHTLAASGSVEAIFTCLALQKNIIPPNLRFTTPMEETGLKPVTKITEKPIHSAISNSFAFGGNNVSLVFSKYS